MLSKLRKGYFIVLHAISLKTSSLKGHKSRWIMWMFTSNIFIFNEQWSTVNKRLAAENLTWTYYNFLSLIGDQSLFHKLHFCRWNTKGGRVHFQRGRRQSRMKLCFWLYFCKPFWENNFGNFSTYFNRRNVQLIVVTRGQELDKFICWDFYLPIFLLF